MQTLFHLYDSTQQLSKDRKRRKPNKQPVSTKITMDVILQVHMTGQVVLPLPRHSFVALGLPSKAHCPCIKGTSFPSLEKFHTHTHTLMTPHGFQSLMDLAVSSQAKTLREAARCRPAPDWKENSPERMQPPAGISGAQNGLVQQGFSSSLDVRCSLLHRAQYGNINHDMVTFQIKSVTSK